MDEGSDGPELSVVVPVFREADGVAHFLEHWTSTLDGLEIDYEMLIYDDGSGDDGSGDGTLDVLERCAEERPRLKVQTQDNRGHGRTIRRGYEESRGQWVFQVDSDDEISAEHFHRLWEQRENHDLLLGSRENTDQPRARRLVSTLSSLAVGLCFGRGIRDVNTPYRLMRRSALSALLPLVPEHAFAPNVILSGLFVRNALRITELSVPRRSSAGRRSSLGGARLWRGVAQSFLETLQVAVSVRRAS